MKVFYVYAKLIEFCELIGSFWLKKRQFLFDIYQFSVVNVCHEEKMVTRSNWSYAITEFMLTKAFRISGWGKKMIHPCIWAWMNLSLSGPANFSTVPLSFFFDTSQAQGTFPLLLLLPSIHPSTHLKPNWRPVSACNFYHDHTFVLVPIIKHCTSPWPPCWSVVLVKKVFRLSVDAGRETCVCRVSPTLLCGSHSLVWMLGIAVRFKRDSHTHIRDCKNIYLSPSLSFDSRLKLTATRFYRPFRSHSSVLSRPPPTTTSPFFGPAHIQISRLWLLKEFTALSLPIWSW